MHMDLPTESFHLHEREQYLRGKGMLQRSPRQSAGSADGDQTPCEVWDKGGTATSCPGTNTSTFLKLAP